MANFRGNQSQRTAAQSKQIMVEALGKGMSVPDALKRADRSRSWYEKARNSDKEFAGACDAARAAALERTQQVVAAEEARNLAVAESNPEGPQSKLGPFHEWSETYLGLKVWPHQQNMVDVVEGRKPSFLHDSMTYEPGVLGSRRVLINVPPNHAKTMVLSIGYTTYRIIENPNINILLVSKTQEMAKKILYAVKQRLTHPRYARLQARYAPIDGWKATADQWSATKVYLGGEARDSGEKDPTIEAVGVGGQIYGSRASLIILDDVVTLSNSSEFEKQNDWIRQEVASRLGPGGQIIVVGTRVAALDLYRYLRDPETYTDGTVPWTYLSMPAVLEYGAEPKDWQTLWPVTDEPFVEDDEPVEVINGKEMFPRWTGPRMNAVRNEVGPRRWSLVYQQADVPEDAVFDTLCVRGAVDGGRRVGPLDDPMGWYVICGMDPAVAGVTAVVAYAVDRQTGNRKILDVRTMKGPTPAQIRDLIEDMTETYRPNEWVIEANAFQGFLARDEEITRYLANKGIILRPTFTGKDKHDPDFGVASMSSLFGTRTAGGPGQPSRHQGDNLLSLPSSTAAGVKVLIEELVSWNPELPVSKRRQDTVMALWFCETRAREVVQSTRRGSSFHANGNKFLSERARSRRQVIDLTEYMEHQQAANWM